MNKRNIDDLNQFVNENINIFHLSKAKTLANLALKNLLKRKNPYLFKAKNITTASQLVTELLDAYLSASEEKIFGDFLEELAIFISSRAYGGRKSTATGIDLEFTDKKVHYLVSIKSGINWGNSSQKRKQESDFQNAVRVLKQSKQTLNVQPILGICYGKTKTSHLRGYRKVVGQNFWYLISGDPNLYTDMIEPIGYKARKHNEKFLEEKGKIVNLFTRQFIEEFCKDGVINWPRLVEFNSGNLNLKVSSTASH